MARVRAATSAADFLQVRGLLDEMAAWDASESAARGIDGEAVVRHFYSDTPDQLQAKFTAPAAGLFLCADAGGAVGCAGFGRYDTTAGELQKLYVRPGCRGQGHGARLMDAVLNGLAAGGHRRACLETVNFMTDAIALYRRFGFVPCAAFREPPAGLLAITLFMERNL